MFDNSAQMSVKVARREGQGGEEKIGVMAQRGNGKEEQAGVVASAFVRQHSRIESNKRGKRRGEGGGKAYGLLAII